MTAAGNLERTLRRECLSAAWLASRLGVQSAHVDMWRRDGQLLGVRLPGTQTYFYPGWQLGSDGGPLPVVARLIEAARTAGLDELGLYRVMNSRMGLGGRERLVDALREGRDEYVLQAVKSAAAQA
ncbi:MAG: hypothetical protein ACRDN6_09755 [Gaiellaceae bacterium]